jgi:Chaperone of endosialidase
VDAGAEGVLILPSSTISLDNGLGFYRFSYNGSDKAYVGVIAQEVQAVMPSAVVRGRDGYLQVLYYKLGVPFQTYDQWIASGSHVPATQ